MTSSNPYTCRVVYRHVRGESEEEEERVELKINGDMGDRESASDGDRPEEDSTSLIREEEEIDENGVARDYEVALKYIGFGLFHVILILINGVALLSDAVEVHISPHITPRGWIAYAYIYI